ncbi:MAG TPA: aconitate hydratase, partial [Solirubrobacterales bacterium]|nr:aconitate hydratase [Solirubrobacterales bacterium]
LEYLATVVADRADEDGTRIALPDTVVGTDSHTTMVNGLGVLAWGVGGIEAEAALLGQPIYMAMPRVVGVRLSGELPQGSTATDLVLVVTQLLRSFGVVGAFVEFAGDGLAGLSLADRATIANMSPEFGATSTLFPIDDETLAYLRLTGRSPERVALVEAYAKAQGMWRREGHTPDFDDLLTLDLASVEPSVAGPRRPQDRVPLTSLRDNFRTNFPDGLRPVDRDQVEALRPAGGVVEESSAESFPASDPPGYTSATATLEQPAPAVPDAPAAPAPAASTAYPAVSLDVRGEHATIRTGSVAIAAITSCTNTSNPTVMVGAGLLARNAVARGLKVPPTVKTSLAPGSKAVTAYLENAGLMAPLEELGFALAGYGCTTCIGNSGPLDQPIAEAIEKNELVTAAVLSGNRNFEGRIHPLARASYLASPPLVVAFALAGRVDVDLTEEPVGIDDDGKPVFLTELWPSQEEIKSVIHDAIDPELFKRTYASVFEGDDRWRALPIPEGDRYEWDPSSTYVARPPYFEGLAMEPAPPADIVDARVLALLGDSVTTDHISPAGSIVPWAPAGTWLQEHGVSPVEFNSYGARRGHHEVLIRGTFGNIRLRNQLASEGEGPYTVHLPDGEEGFIYDVSMRYRNEGVPTIVIAGKEYGSGSSRDWAAKGPLLLGVRAVIAQTFERIHRTNLVGMGILPLEFLPGETPASLGLTGREAYSIKGVATIEPRSRVKVEAHADDGNVTVFEATCRIDGPIELDYYRNGGILPAVLRRLARG